MKRRVVVTGLGLVSPLGIGVEDTWSALCVPAGPGVTEITRFDATPYPTKIAAEVKGFKAEDFMPHERGQAVRTVYFLRHGRHANGHRRFRAYH